MCNISKSFYLTPTDLSRTQVSPLCSFPQESMHFHSHMQSDTHFPDRSFTMLNLAHLCSCKHEEKMCILVHCDFTCATNMRFNTPSLQRGMVEIFSPQLSLLIHFPPASLHQRKPYEKNACLSVSSPFLELYCCSRNKQ